jgi:hypothetical protein
MPASWQMVPVRWPTLAGQMVGLRVSMDSMKFAGGRWIHRPGRRWAELVAHQFLGQGFDLAAAHMHLALGADEADHVAVVGLFVAPDGDAVGIAVVVVLGTLVTLGE